MNITKKRLYKIKDTKRQSKRRIQNKGKNVVKHLKNASKGKKRHHNLKNKTLKKKKNRKGIMILQNHQLGGENGDDDKKGDKDNNEEKEVKNEEDENEGGDNKDEKKNEEDENKEEKKNKEDENEGEDKNQEKGEKEEGDNKKETKPLWSPTQSDENNNKEKAKPLWSPNSTTEQSSTNKEGEDDEEVGDKDDKGGDGDEEGDGYEEGDGSKTLSKKEKKQLEKNQNELIEYITIRLVQHMLYTLCEEEEEGEKDEEEEEGDENNEGEEEKENNLDEINSEADLKKEIRKYLKKNKEIDNKIKNYEIKCDDINNDMTKIPIDEKKVNDIIKSINDKLNANDKDIFRIKQGIEKLAANKPSNQSGGAKESEERGATPTETPKEVKEKSDNLKTKVGPKWANLRKTSILKNRGSSIATKYNKLKQLFNKKSEDDPIARLTQNIPIPSDKKTILQINLKDISGSVATNTVVEKTKTHLEDTLNVLFSELQGLNDKVESVKNKEGEAAEEKKEDVKVETKEEEEEVP